MAETIALEFVFLAMAIGVFAAAGGIILGYKRRLKSHQLSIKRDLCWWVIRIAEVCVFLVAVIVEIGVDWLLMIAMTMIIFSMFYKIGYNMARPIDNISVALYSKDLSQSKQGPIVYYYADGEMYEMIQTLKGAIRAKLGVREPLDMDLSSVARTRPDMTFDGRRKPIKQNLANASKWDNEETETVGKIKIGTIKIRDEHGNVIERTPKYLFYFTVRKVIVRFSDCVETDPTTFDTSVEMRGKMVDRLYEEIEKNKRLEVELNEEKYDAAAKILTGIFKTNLDASDDIINDIREKYSILIPKPKGGDERGDTTRGLP